MKKLESSITNMVIVLVGVALITGAILAYVNNVTADPIKVQAEKTLTDGIKKVMGGSDDVKVSGDATVTQDVNGKPAEYVIHFTEDSKGNKLGAAVESTSNGFGGELKVLVGFNNDGDILGYTILQTAETPGLGAKAQEWFQKDGKGSIIGMNPSEALTVSKDGGKVNAITASTITSRAFLVAVNNAYKAYMQKQKGGNADGETAATKVNQNK